MALTSNMARGPPPNLYFVWRTRHKDSSAGVERDTRIDVVQIASRVDRERDGQAIECEWQDAGDFPFRSNAEAHSGNCDRSH